ncbi:MAG TPA: alpha-amylase family glycosyl hydrolase [Tepidisphaeraceae bacterium]|jgi:glycosidase
MAERLTSLQQLDFKPRGKVQPSPAEWRDQFIYQLLIDRFDDNKEHPPYDAKNAKHGRDEKKSGCFQGGKIKGITRRLDYIKNLGCTTIWISPPFKNRQECQDACHGYGIQDFLAIDPRFGSTEDLRELVDEAHKRGMFIVLDIVIQHTGNNWSYPGDKGNPFKEDGQYPFGAWRGRDNRQIPPDKTKDLGPDDGVWPVELQNPDFYKRRGEIRNLLDCGDDERINGDFFVFKDLDLKNPAVLDIIIKCYKFWISAVDCDGFRIDTVTNTEPEATAIFCNAIREYARSIGKHNFLIYGEIVGSDDLLQKYIGGNIPVPGEGKRFPMFSAVLDFPLYFVLEEVIKGFRNPEELRNRAEKFRWFYRDYSEVGQYFITFVDNHDQIARPYKRFGYGVDDPRQAVLAIGYLLTSMGIPCIYYGTEQGFDGGGKSDQCIRETMFGGTWGGHDTTGVQFFNPEHPIYQGIARIAKVRAAEAALKYGREYFRQISGNGKDFGYPIDGNCTLAYSRVLDIHSIVVALNLQAADRNDWILLDPNLNPAGKKLKNLLGDQTLTIEQTPAGPAVKIPLKPREMMILKPV